MIKINIPAIATHRTYILLWVLGYVMLWVLSEGGRWNGEWWQYILLVTISLMVIPWIWTPPSIIPKPRNAKREKTKTPTGYRRVKRPDSMTPQLGDTNEDESSTLSHMQIKLSTAIIRAYMMEPYYLTYKIIYIAGRNDEPSDIIFRRHRQEGKGCQYYYDKALAHLTSCQLERMHGFMSDQHNLMMAKQARDACRKVLMTLDPEHLDNELPKLYCEVDSQASEMAELIMPHIKELATRISPLSRQERHMLPEAEIIHWFEYLNLTVKYKN